MANKRIKDLSTTAAVTASDDFIAVDGATNGTRKLNAYSPTFGGNLTVSGTGTSSFAGLVKATGNAATSFGVEIANGAGSAGTAQYYLTAGNGAGFTAFRFLRGNGAAGYEDNSFNADCFAGARFNLNALGGSGSNFTISGGNLTVSGTGNNILNSGGGNLLIGTTTDGGQKLQVNGTAAISGALSIGNTVQTAVSVASTHKVTISIGGTTYYLLATNV